MLSINDKLNSLKSFDLINSFPNKDLKLCNKAEQPGFHYGIGLIRIATSIETFLKENASSILNVANSSDLKMIESNLSKLDQLMAKEEDAHAHLMNAISIIQQLQQQKAPQINTQRQKLLFKPKKPITKESLLNGIKNDLLKIDLSHPNGLQKVRELAVKVSQAKKHPEFDAQKDISLVNLETGLGMILNPSIFSPCEAEKIVINLFRNDDVDELKKEIDAYLMELKNAHPDQFLAVKGNFIKALLKYQKSEHLSEPIKEIIQTVQKLPEIQKKALKQLQTSIAKALENHFLDCSASDRLEKTLLKESANDVLRLLKKTDLAINTSLASDFLRIQEQVMVTRISNITSSRSFDPVKQLLPMITNLKEVEAKCNSYLHKCIENIHKKFDVASNNKFSELIKNYPYIDYRARSFYIVASVLKAHAYSLMNGSPLTEEKIIEKINLMLAENKSKYQWLLANLPYIEKPYNQGSDYNRSLKGGTCFENSCDRQALLLDTPEIASKDIPMGSTHSGRFMESLIVATQSKTGDVSQGVFMSHYLEDSLKLKMTGYDELTIPNNNANNSRQYVIDQLCNLRKFSPSTLKATILIMDPSSNESGESHVINVQIMRNKQLFRFIDDNLGIVKYPTEAEFQKHFKWWLEITYPQLDQYFVSSVNKK